VFAHLRSIAYGLLVYAGMLGIWLALFGGALYFLFTGHWAAGLLCLALIMLWAWTTLAFKRGEPSDSYGIF
jgi:hypothetical protein